MVVMLKQCCCGCTLKTGALIIAVVYAILAALNVLVFSLTAAESAQSLHYMQLSLEMELEEPDNKTESPVVSTKSTPHNTTDNDTDQDFYTSFDLRIKLLTIWMWLSIFIVLVECGVLVINIFLMFAANKDNGRLVYAWVLGFGALSCCLLLLELVIVGVIFYGSSSIAAVVVLVVTLLEAAGAAYSALVGYSYHRYLVGTAVARRISRQDD